MPSLGATINSHVPALSSSEGIVWLSSLRPLLETATREAAVMASDASLWGGDGMDVSGKQRPARSVSLIS